MPPVPMNSHPQGQGTPGGNQGSRGPTVQGVGNQGSRGPTGQGVGTQGNQGTRGPTGQGVGNQGQGSRGPTGQGIGTQGNQGSRGPNGQGFGTQGNRGPTGGNPGGGRQFGNSAGGNAGRPAGTTVVHTRNGGDVVRGANGSVREVHTAGGAVIHHAPTGVNRVEVARPGGRVVVANARGGSGYVQRPLVINNRTFVQRTYVVGGVSYARVYRPYAFGGISLNVYTPYRFYRPAFYAYAFNPWARPVYYNFGWGGSPWFGFYGGFFTPYPYYATPSLWLTDYLIANTLQDAYQARLDAAAAASIPPQNYGATPLTPDVKQAIADEVHRQLDQERNEQQNLQSAGPAGAPPLVSSNGPQVFVVANALTVNSAGGECPVTEGDVLQMNGAPAPNSTYADVVVLASKGQDCRKGTMVSVALNDLQEMQNQMRATIDKGLGDLQSKQGQGGLPTLPAGAAAPPDNAFGNQVQPDANVATEITQVAQDASRQEQDIVNQSLDNSSGTPPTISLGMTVSEVEQIMGKPKDVANVGTKRIYVYSSMKVIFIDGKVNDVQ
jgi:hypothetical protein